MKKVKFTNKIFYWLLTGFIIILLLYNIIVSIQSSNIYGLMPILIQVALLVLIREKHEYTRLGIYIWAAISLIIACGFDLVADLMDYFNDGIAVIKIDSVVYNLLGLALGILIVDFTKRTVLVTSLDTDTQEDV